MSIFATHETPYSSLSFPQFVKFANTTSHPHLAYSSVATIDAALVCLSYFLAQCITPDVLGLWHVGADLVIMLVAYAALAMCLPTLATEPDATAAQVVRRSAATVVCHFLLCAGLYALCQRWMGDMRCILARWFTLLVLLTAGRLLCRALWARMWRSGWQLRPALLVGESDKMQALADRLKRPGSGYRLCGIFAPDSATAQPTDAPQFDMAAEAAAYIAAHPGLHTLFCQPSTLTTAQNETLLCACTAHGVRYLALPAYVPNVQRQMMMEDVHGIPMFALRSEMLCCWQLQLFKRLTDLVATFLYMATLFPFVYMIVALRIKREEAGPVLVRRKFYGRGGKPFTGLYFRTTRCDDPSVTLRAGQWIERCGWHQLPLLLRVLTGHISLTGPRYHVQPSFAAYERLTSQHGVCQRVKPGLSGCQGVCHSDDAIAQDVAFVNRWTPWLDFRLALGLLWRMPSEPHAEHQTPQNSIPEASAEPQASSDTYNPL